jgi:transcriptional regulator of arginine metabolism
MTADRTAERTRKIREIITQQTIGTQAELVAALRRRGIRVTQATVSRDIRHLGVLKIRAGRGQPRYGLPDAAREPPPNAAEHLASVFNEFATGLELALDLILVKTVSGGADPVAQAIDDMRWADVAGTVAGEDTIIVVPRSRHAAQGLRRRLRQLVFR